MNKPVLIAELGLLHYRSPEVVRDCARKAKAAGFDALKIQHYSRLTYNKFNRGIRNKYKLRELGSYDLYKMSKAVKEEGIQIGCTFHDHLAITSSGIDFIKLGHKDTDKELVLAVIKTCAHFNKPLYVSFAKDCTNFKIINDLCSWLDVPFHYMYTTEQYPTDKAPIGLIAGGGFSSHLKPDDLLAFLPRIAHDLPCLEVHIRPDIEHPGPEWLSKDLSVSWPLSRLHEITDLLERLNRLL